MGIGNEMRSGQIGASFRDPSGFVFVRDGGLYRQVNISYQQNYDLLFSSGLYDALAGNGLLVPHCEVDIPPEYPDTAYKIIEPQRVPFISYPYEWCFSQFKDAALLTLSIQRLALDHGMTLKDATAYNVEFMYGRPVFIDTLSFEKYVENVPWTAYRQFCQHFLAPLALMSKCDINLSILLRRYIDGIPLDLANHLLKGRMGLNLGLRAHIGWHAKAQKKYESTPVDKSRVRMSKFALMALIDGLESTIRRLTWDPCDTEWGDYYEDTNYSQDAQLEKKELVARFVDKAKSKFVWDLGANTGYFSKVPAEKGIFTVAFDVDPAAVEKHYRENRSSDEQFILPLIVDLTNPSPAIGWAHSERTSFMGRGPADTVMALALIHHLAISNNLPLARIADFFAQICGESLIIEFVPKEDSQVRRLLATREDIFPAYTRECFEKEFEPYFVIDEAASIRDSHRTLYLMTRRK